MHFEKHELETEDKRFNIMYPMRIKLNNKQTRKVVIYNRVKPLSI